MELASLFAAHWGRFAAAHRHLLTGAHHRAAEAVLACRTGALGGQVHHCGDCQRQRYVYHSCHHRACPKCGGRAQHEWAAAQEAKLLRAHYFLLTFTLPAELRPFAYRHQRWFYDVMFRAMAATLASFAQDERHLGGTPGFSAVLHTWTRQMQYHPHLHVIIPGLALSADGLRVRRAKGKGYLFPVKALGAAFRHRVRELIAARDREPTPGREPRRTSARDQEEPTPHLASIEAKVWRQAWVIDARAVGRGKAAVRYLARYVTKTAISEPRLLGYDAAGHLRLHCQDSQSRRWHIVTLGVDEFLRRWSLHVLPKGLVRVRHYGWLSAAARRKRERLHHLLGTKAAPRPRPTPIPAPQCPCCGKPMTLLCVIRRAPRGRSHCARLPPPHHDAHPPGARSHSTSKPQPKGASRAPPPFATA